jgi:hypothetical protein
MQHMKESVSVIMSEVYALKDLWESFWTYQHLAAA